jgi:prepilin-type N-terminal cleavage/methylation domain-containing protein
MNRIKLGFIKNGFTLIELVVTLLIVGILAAYAAPSINLTNFRSQGFVQQATATIRLGQKLAITSGCNVDVFIDSNNCTLTWDAGSTCDVPGAAIINPATGQANFCLDSTPTGNPTANFTFNNIGAPTAAVPQINFGGGRTLDVVSNTGFINE